jgi:hypothetical protein
MAAAAMNQGQSLILPCGGPEQVEQLAEQIRRRLDDRR